MARVKRSPARKGRKKKVLQRARGFRGGRKKLYRTAVETVRRAEVYSYRDRKVRKRDFRSLWVVRIAAACKNEDIAYSRFIHGLDKAGVKINRKNLAEMALNDTAGFKTLVELAKEQLVA